MERTTRDAVHLAALRLAFAAGVAGVIAAGTAVPADAQVTRDTARAGGQRPPQQQGPQRRLNGVLGGVPLTAEDSMVQSIVARLDFDSYKNIVKGLTQFGEFDTSSLVSVGGGGAPAPPELVKRVESTFSRGRPGIGYGMTETNAYGPQNSGSDYVTHPTSTGRWVPTLGAAGVLLTGPSKKAFRHTPSMSLLPKHSVIWKPAKPTMWYQAFDPLPPAVSQMGTATPPWRSRSRTPGARRRRAGPMHTPPSSRPR